MESIFRIPDGSYYEFDDGVSWGINPVYVHDWNSSGESEIKFQVSRRENSNASNRATLADRAKLLYFPAISAD